MLPTQTRFLALSILAFLPACHSTTSWRIDDGLAAQSVEVQIDDEGHTREIEYIIAPDEVPENIHQAMDALFPDGVATGAEKEYVSGKLHWELTKDVDGFAVEAMFTEDGTLHSAEAEVSRSSVPQAVRDLVQRSGWGAPRAWEQIRDSENELVEYHVKTSRNSRDYKLVISLEAQLIAVWREVEAEIELPVDPASAAPRG